MLGDEAAIEEANEIVEPHSSWRGLKAE
jgi:hypothetical protein